MKEFLVGLLVVVTFPIWGTGIILCLTIAGITEIGALVLRDV